MPVHNDQIDRCPDGQPDTTERNPVTRTPVIIDLNATDNEAQIAIRHPDGQVLVMTVNAC